MLVVGTEDELAEKGNLVSVLAFGLHLVGCCRTEVFQSLGILSPRKQDFINHDKQLASPVGIELAAEVLVGVEGRVVLKDCL